MSREVPKYVPEVEERDRHQKKSSGNKGVFGIEHTMIFFGKTWIDYHWFKTEKQRDQSFDSFNKKSHEWSSVKKINKDEYERTKASERG